MSSQEVYLILFHNNNFQFCTVRIKTKLMEKNLVVWFLFLNYLLFIYLFIFTLSFHAPRENEKHLQKYRRECLTDCEDVRHTFCYSYESSSLWISSQPLLVVYVAVILDAHILEAYQNYLYHGINIFNVYSWYLTDRFHVAVCLFSNRSQMTSNCDEVRRKKWHTRRVPLFSYYFLMESICFVQ